MSVSLSLRHLHIGKNKSISIRPIQSRSPFSISFFIGSAKKDVGSLIGNRNRRSYLSLCQQNKCKNTCKVVDCSISSSSSTTFTLRAFSSSSKASFSKSSSAPKGGKFVTPVTWASLTVMGITGLGLAYYYATEKEKKKKEAMNKVVTFGKPALGCSWTLVDYNGYPRTDKDFLGNFNLLYFGFTRCPDICPSELVKVAKVIKLLEKDPAYVKGEMPFVKPLFISVDPDRDTVGQMRNYAQDFHPSILYLTGTKEQIAKVAQGYRVYFSKADEDEGEDNYLVDHSIVLYLLGPDGIFLDFFTQSMTPEDIVKRIKNHAANFTKQ